MLYYDKRAKQGANRDKLFSPAHTHTFSLSHTQLRFCAHILTYPLRNPLTHTTLANPCIRSTLCIWPLSSLLYTDSVSSFVGRKYVLVLIRTWRDFNYRASACGPNRHPQRPSITSPSLRYPSSTFTPHPRLLLFSAHRQNESPSSVHPLLSRSLHVSPSTAVTHLVNVDTFIS